MITDRKQLSSETVDVNILYLEMGIVLEPLQNSRIEHI